MAKARKMRAALGAYVENSITLPDALAARAIACRGNQWAIYGRARGKFYRLGPYEEPDVAWALAKLLPTSPKAEFKYHQGGAGQPVRKHYGWYVAEFNANDRYDEWTGA